MMLGGPLGAVIGAVMGSSVSSNRGTGGHFGSPIGGGARGPRSQQEMQMVFAISLTSLAAKVAKADGVVSADEVQAFDGFLRDSLRMSAADRKIAASVFNQAKESGDSTMEFTRQIRELLAGQPDRIRDIVTILCSLAMSDGEFHPKEDELIRKIATELGLSDYDYQSCRATFAAERGNSTGNVENSYQVLGVPSSASDQEVKTAHRRLVKEYHPDILRSKGLADDFQEFAKQKTSAINDAWSTVKSARNL